MNHETEKAAAGYLVGLPPEERKLATARIAGLIEATAPPAEAAEASAPPVRNLTTYLDEKIEVPPFLVSEGQVVRGEITVMIARAGKGKTTLGMNRIIRWAAGRPLFDGLTESQVPVEPLKMLLIENEGVAYFMQEKLGILHTFGAGLTDDEKELAGENAMVWGDGGYSGLKIDRERDLDQLRRAADTLEPDIIMLEPFRGIWSGEENDATAMEAVLDDLVALGSEFNCGILLSHHERKGGAGEDGEEMSRARGSGDLEGKVAVMEHWRSVHNDDFRELGWSKSRYGKKMPTIRLTFDHPSWRYSVVPDDEVNAGILGVMNEDPDSWYRREELMEALNEGEAKIKNALERLQKEERVVKKKGEPQGWRYRLKTDENPNTGGLPIQ